MNNKAHPPLYRSRRRRDVRGWIIALAALTLLASSCWLASMAEAAIPPRPGTQATLPAPVGRHETRLYCRNFAYRPAARIDCRRIGGYR